jgi:DNA helicase HerA-like ATPase
MVENIVVGRDRDDLKKYGEKGTAFIGKHIVGKGEDAHLTNPIMMDVTRPHVLLVCGKRGTGKSYSAAIIAEEILALPPEIKDNLAVVMFDTMGIYWSMKNPNERDKEILKEWGLKPEPLPIQLFVPTGYVEDYERAGVTYDHTFNLVCSDLSAEDWVLTFGFSFVDEYGTTIERTIKQLKRTKAGKYSIQDIVAAIEADRRAEQKVKDALVNRFSAAEGWGIFGAEGTRLEDLIKPGTVSVVDVSHYMQVSAGWSVRSMIVGLLSRRVYHARSLARKSEELEVITGESRSTMPMVWMIIDEAHQFLPTQGQTAATEPLLTLVKQGREPGISLIFITQRPNKLHEDALAQSDIIIAHRLTAEADITALRGIMQTYMLDDIQEYINTLPRKKGTAIVLDDNSERIYAMQARPRKTWHAGGSPIAIKEITILG